MDLLNGTDQFPRIITALGITVLVVLIGMTVVSGIYSATRHPGDELLDMIYAAVVYTSPYVLYGMLGLALFILRRSRVISLTFSVGGIVLLVLWIYNNLVQTLEDVALGYSLYETLGRNFFMSAIVAGVFAALQLMQAFLIIPREYD